MVDWRLYTRYRLVSAISLGAAAFIAIFPPWKAIFEPLEPGTFPPIAVSLPWPNPSFSGLEGSAFPRHEFSTFVSILTPPRPRADIAAGQVVGTWNTSVDVVRLLVMMGGLILIALTSNMLGREAIRASVLAGDGSTRGTA